MLVRNLALATILATMAGLAPASALTLSSPEVRDGGTAPGWMVFDGFGCTGANRPPALRWTAPPPGTKALALTMYDPDAPTTVGWVHWTVYRIPVAARSLSAALPPGAVAGLTDFGKPGYGGPCPPVGDRPHHYHIELDALDADLPLGPTTTYAAYRFMSHGHVLASARMTLRYGR